MVTETLHEGQKDTIGASECGIRSNIRFFYLVMVLSTECVS